MIQAKSDAVEREVRIAARPAQAAVEKLKSGQADENGVIGINAYVGATDTWCITEAPNAEAVHKGHEAMGIKLGAGDVQEVQALV